MKTKPIQVPDSIIINGKKLIRKSVYQGPTITKYPKEIQVRIDKLLKDKADLGLEIYKIETIISNHRLSFNEQHFYESSLYQLNQQRKTIDEMIFAIKQDYLKSITTKNDTPAKLDIKI